MAVILYDNGNTDAIQLATVDPFTGKLVPLPHPFNTFPLFARIVENAWYTVIMELTVDLAHDGHSLLVEAAVISLQDPTDPNSDFDQVIGGMRLRTPLEALGLQPQGQVGIMASAISAVVDSSVTTWIAAEGFEGPCSE